MHSPSIRLPAEPSRRRAPQSAAWLAAYAAALVYASLYPWTGWRAPDTSMFTFLVAPWPRWWTAYDVATNVVAYLPLGLLACVAIARLARTHVLRAAPGALAACAALSFSLESVQSLLPARVPSRLDLLTNVAGAAFGIAIAAWFGRRRIERLPRALRNAFTVAPGATAGAVLLVAWPIAQWYPQSLVFATGDLLFAWPSASASASGWRAALILPARYEPFVEACAVSLAVVAIASLVREIFVAPAAVDARPAAWPIALPIVAACVIKSVAGAVVLGPAHAFGWLSAAAQGGLVAGAIASIALVPATPGVRAACALASIALGTMLVNLAPPNEYYLSMLAHWEGQWSNFHGLLRALATAWPFAMLAWWGGRVYARL
ncbi:MAG: VanZ family protein [Burkholderiaceae bacterium]|nr:VanZ family protein [Burkholderiaceae bacterium]